MGWIFGYTVGVVVVLVVVGLLVLMIRGARRAADQAEAIVAALERARDNSAGLWQVQETIAATSRITAAAAAVRAQTEDRSRSGAST